MPPTDDSTLPGRGLSAEAEASGVRPRLSVAIVCKNNEETIERTLASVAAVAGEIVAVDSGSTDRTVEILSRFGARVIRHEWLGHVRTKQLALEACSLPWVLCVDSDESLEPELVEAVRGVVGGAQPASSSTAAMGYEVNRTVYYRGRPLRHTWQPEWRLRLVSREHFQWSGLDPHDSLAAVASGVPTRIARLRGTMRHDSIGTFAEFFVKQASHARTMAKSLHGAGKRGSVLRLITSPIGAFAKQVVIKQAWRDGIPGWLAAASAAAGTLIKHAVLLELSYGEVMKKEPKVGSASAGMNSEPRRDAEAR